LDAAILMTIGMFISVLARWAGDYLWQRPILVIYTGLLQGRRIGALAANFSVAWAPLGSL
jgi:hypothetical protein